VAEAQLCTFRLGGLHVGVDIGSVQEVLADPDVTPVPFAPPAVAGLLNLRGQILTVVDGRARLELPARDAGGGTHVILRHGSEIVSLVVDSDDEVVDIQTDAIEEVPTTVGEKIRACAIGAYKLEDDLLLVLDVDRVLTVV